MEDNINQSKGFLWNQLTSTFLMRETHLNPQHFEHCFCVLWSSSAVCLRINFYAEALFKTLCLISSLCKSFESFLFNCSIKVEVDGISSSSIALLDLLEFLKAWSFLPHCLLSILMTFSICPPIQYTRILSYRHLRSITWKKKHAKSKWFQLIFREKQLSIWIVHPNPKHVKNKTTSYPKPQIYKRINHTCTRICKGNCCLF